MPLGVDAWRVSSHDSSALESLKKCNSWDWPELDVVVTVAVAVAVDVDVDVAGVDACAAALRRGLAAGLAGFVVLAIPSLGRGVWLKNRKLCGKFIFNRRMSRPMLYRRISRRERAVWCEVTLKLKRGVWLQQLSRNATGRDQGLPLWDSLEALGNPLTMPRVSSSP